MLILSIPKAADGNRTHDLFLTKEVLYQLSYSSVVRPTPAPRPREPAGMFYAGDPTPARAGDGI